MSPEKRVELNRALAKAIAYKIQGNEIAANRWAVVLIGLVRESLMLNTSEDYFR